MLVEEGQDHAQMTQLVTRKAERLQIQRSGYSLWLTFSDALVWKWHSHFSLKESKVLWGLNKYSFTSEWRYRTSCWITQFSGGLPCGEFPGYFPSTFRTYECKVVANRRTATEIQEISVQKCQRVQPINQQGQQITDTLVSVCMSTNK